MFPYGNIVNSMVWTWIRFRIYIWTSIEWDRKCSLFDGKRSLHPDWSNEPIWILLTLHRGPIGLTQNPAGSWNIINKSWSNRSITRFSTNHPPGIRLPTQRSIRVFYPGLVRCIMTSSKIHVMWFRQCWDIACVQLGCELQQNRPWITHATYPTFQDWWVLGLTCYILVQGSGPNAPLG